MSHYDYIIGREILSSDPPFAALVMAAMRKADDNNLEMLKDCWPEIWEELEARYMAPDGYLPEDYKDWIASEEHLFCKCGAQFGSMEAITAHIRASHLKGGDKNV